MKRSMVIASGPVAQATHKPVHYVVWRSEPGGMESYIPAYLERDRGSVPGYIFSLRPGPDRLGASAAGYTQGDRSNLRLYPALFRYGRAHRREVFHLLNSGPLVLLTLLLAGVRSPIYHIHGTKYWSTPLGRALLKAVWMMARPFKVRYIANSHFCAETFRRTAVPVLPEVIYNGFDTQALLAQRRRRSTLRRMAYAGRLAQGKNAHLAIGAFNRVAGNMPHLELHIAGTGALQERLMDLALASPFRKRIFFHGWVGDMPAFYADMDLVLFPSSHESFGNVLAEALITGLPVLVSDLPAFEEIHGDRATFSLGSPEDEERFLAGFASALGHFDALAAKAYALSDRLAATFGMSQHLAHIARIHASA